MTFVIALTICAWLVVKSTDGPGGGMVTSANRSSGRHTRHEPLERGNRAANRVGVDVVAIDDQHMRRPGRRSVLFDTYGSRGFAASACRFPAFRDELGADDPPYLPIDGDGEFRRAQIAHGHPLRIDDGHVDFHHFDARSKHRCPIGLRQEHARSRPGRHHRDQHRQNGAHRRSP
jgi:hypothetical protein